MYKLFFASLLLLTEIQAATPICVRNYGETTCTQLPQYYALVRSLNEEEDGSVCARIYSSFHCMLTPQEYNTIKTIDGKKICVLNTNQPPVSNLCVSTPQFYAYVRAE